MNYLDARKQAEEIIETARTMNITSEHPESARQARLAVIIIDLANQLEAYESTPVDVADTPSIEPVGATSPKKKGKK